MPVYAPTIDLSKTLPKSVKKSRLEDVELPKKSSPFLWAFLRLIFFYILAWGVFYYILKLDIDSIALIFLSAFLIAMISLRKYTRPIAYLLALATFLYIVYLKVPVYPYQINQLKSNEYEILALLADENQKLIESKAWVFINWDRLDINEFPKNFSSLKNIRFVSTENLNSRIILTSPSWAVLIMYPQTSLSFSWKNTFLEWWKVAFSGQYVFIEKNKYFNTSLAYKSDEILFSTPSSQADKETLDFYHKKFDSSMKTQFEKNYAWTYSNTPALDYIIEAKMKYCQFLDPSLQQNYQNYLAYKNISWKKSNF